MARQCAGGDRGRAGFRARRLRGPVYQRAGSSQRGRRLPPLDRVRQQGLCRGQRRPRRAVRRRASAALAAHDQRRGHAARRSAHRDRAESAASRPPVGLPAQDQLLRRLDGGHVGAVHPRPGRIRHECHRADPAALGRRRRQPALPAAADADDDRDVAAGRRLRDRPLDLVSGDGPRLLRPQDGRVRLERVERRLPPVAAHRCGVRSRRRSRPHPAQAPDGVAGETSSGPPPLPSQGADVGFAAELQPGVAGRVLRHPAERAAGLAGRCGRRSADPHQPGPVAGRGSKALPHPRLPRHHAQPSQPVPGAGLGHGFRHHRGPRGDQPAADGRGAHLPPHAPAHQRLYRLLGRLQRRREQDRLERRRLGPRRRCRRGAARVQPLLHRRALRRPVCAGLVGAGAELAGPAAHQWPRVHHAGTVPRDGAVGLATGTAELAVPAGALPRLLRRVHPQPADPRDRPGRAGDGRTARCAARRIAGGDQ